MYNFFQGARTVPVNFLQEFPIIYNPTTRNLLLFEVHYVNMVYRYERKVYNNN